MTAHTPGTTTKPAKPAKSETTDQTAAHEPIVVDMGKKSRKQVRKLRKGKPGRLMNRVAEAIEHLRETGALSSDAQPIIIVVKERPKKRRNAISGLFGIK